jgi:hypothetical protein
VLEGVAFALRDCRDALAATGTRIDSLVAVGGGSRSDYWLQVIATALDHPLSIPRRATSARPSARRGWGMMAATGDTTLATPPRITRTVAPDPGARRGLRRRPRPLPPGRQGHPGADMTDFFAGIPRVRYEGPESDNEFAFRHYNPDEVVMGKRMEDHLRFAVAYWHSFAWPGGDPFGGQTFDRPWFGDTMELAKLKADVAFEMFDLLGAPFFCFHDADVRPEGASFAESKANLDEIVDYFAQKMEPRRRSSSGARRTSSPTAASWRARPRTRTPTSSPMRAPR